MTKLKNKNTIYKVLIIIIDIIFLICFIFTAIKWVNNHKEKVQPIVNKNVTYKKFTFELPNDISYRELDNKFFELKSDTFQAIVEIFLDPKHFMFAKRDNYYQVLLNAGVQVEKPYEITITDKKVLIYHKHDNKNSLLCYFQIQEGFAVEIELFNDDNSFDTKNLTKLVSIISNNKYDYESLEKYVYYTTDKDPIFNN